MRFSTRVEYGMLALTDIALQSGNGSSVSAPDIAERQGISQKYLEQILTHLKQAGLIRSQKGLRGGYTLTRPAEAISLAEILNALDKSILEDMDSAGANSRSLREAVNSCLWKEMNQLITEYTKKKTLAEFLMECRERLSGGWDYYEI